MTVTISYFFVACELSCKYFETHSLTLGFPNPVFDLS